MEPLWDAVYTTLALLPFIILVASLIIGLVELIESFISDEKHNTKKTQAKGDNQSDGDCFGLYENKSQTDRDGGDSNG